MGAALAGGWGLAGSLRGDEAATGPRFTSDGSLVRPENVERWVMVGASLGMGYAAPAVGGETSAEPAPGGDRAADSDRRPGGHFHNVYLESGAFERYETTGAFEEGTMLAMVVHEPARHAEPNRRGWFEGDRVGMEVAVKDTRRFEGGWAYFDFTGGGGDLRPAARPFPPAACAACHAAHAANDNVFVQFYPVLRELDARRAAVVPPGVGSSR